MAAWIAHRASRYSVIVSLSEKVGIPLALALRTLGRRTPHVLIGHKLSWPVQRMAWTLTGAQRGFAAVACVSREQLEFTRKPSGMGIDAGHFVYDKVDERFFRPRRVDDDGYVLAVGQEQRDYATLVKAMDGLGKRLVIVASSPWTMSRLPPPEPSAQIDVLAGIPFTELRDLYARARLVVVPVHDVDFAAGVNGLLEGMAMARPVICSRTRGLDGYVDDGVTGVLVPPCDAPALRETIRELWDDRAHRSRLQDAGRAAVEAGMTLDHYVGRMATLAANASSQPPS
jgi:glycosyltransferase involved in cell wall biosynthesis